MLRNMTFAPVLRVPSREASFDYWIRYQRNAGLARMITTEVASPWASVSPGNPGGCARTSGGGRRSAARVAN